MLTSKNVTPLPKRVPNQGNAFIYACMSKLLTNTFDEATMDNSRTDTETHTVTEPETVTATAEAETHNADPSRTGNAGNYSVLKDEGLEPLDSKTELIKSIVLALLSALCYSIVFHFFVNPSRFAPGGFGGIVAIVKHVTGTQIHTAEIDYSMFIIAGCNIPLILLSYKLISKRFALLTFLTTTFMSLFMFLLDNVIDPNYAFSVAGTPLINDVGTRLMAALFGGVACGFSLSLALKGGGCSGGTDIVGMLIQQWKPQRHLGVLIESLNGIIVAISYFIYKDNLTPVFLAIVYMFVSAKTCDFILDYGKRAVKFEVVTNSPEETELIAKELIEKLGHGVTVLPAQGMFEHKERGLLICVVKPAQVNKFKKIIQKYNNTFAYYDNVYETLGKFAAKSIFRRKTTPKNGERNGQP